MSPSPLKRIAAAACALVLAALPLQGQKSDAAGSLHLVKGPTNAALGTVAQAAVPAGFTFLDGQGTRAFLKAQGEPVSGREVGFMISTNKWGVFFIFDPSGYVKDNDKAELDADKLLAAIKQGTAEANKVRQSNGKPPIEVVGWEVPPRYDATTHNLEWAIRATSQGEPFLNYNTRLLGRKGVMEVVLAVDPENLSQTLPAFRSLLSGFSFQSGQTYAEYRPGDKVAKYGLGALVVGGAAVGAAKLGLFAWAAVLFKKAWKLIIVAFAAVAAFFRKLFSRRASRRPSI